MAKVDGISLGALGIGVVLTWSGIQNKAITATIQDIVSGKKPVPGPKPALTPDTASLTASQQAGLGALGGNPTNPLAPGNVSGSAFKNQQIAKLLAAPYGWSSGPNWDALVSLWNSESSWSNTIWNTSASCGGDAFAYGVVQACGHGPHMTIPGHGSVCPYPLGNPGNPPQCGGVSSAAGQIAWGLAYIRSQYGQPVNVPHGGY